MALSEFTAVKMTSETYCEGFSSFLCVSVCLQIHLITQTVNCAESEEEREGWLAEYPAKESSPIEIAAVLVLLRDCVNGHSTSFLPSFPSLPSPSLSPPALPQPP